ncbi:MAG: UbiD family decarboxylase [Deltaproteobacteria bacterium]|nr:UbiD family decarboxylase [Deltaproteobacteria bacterium]
MPYDSLKALIADLEKDGSLQHVPIEVDPAWEVAAVMRRVFRMPQAQRPAVLFDRIKGSDLPLVVGLYGSRRTYARILGVTPTRINERWLHALAHPVPPVFVSGGPCKEVVLRGEAVDLTRFPVPTWTPGRDIAPYIAGASVVTRDPESHVRNVGIYRLQLKGRDRTGLNINPPQHIGIHSRKYRARGQPMQVAMALGADPVVSMVAAAKFPPDTDEFAIAGGLRGAPLELVKCETVDLEVPATAEIVIEGTADLEHLEPEAPFGEYMGYMSPQRLNPVLRVTAVTCQRRAIFHALLSQKPPSESSMLRGISNEASLLGALRGMGVKGVTDVHVTEPGGAVMHVVVAIQKLHPAHPREVMTAVWGVRPYYGKQVIVVDDDIDIRDPFDVEWAVATTVQARRDLVIIPDHTGRRSDLSVEPERRDLDRSDKLGVDATRKWPYPAPAGAGPEHLARVEARWPEYGIREVERE